MLGRLIKYDLKSTTRFLIIIHIFLIVFSIFGRIFLTGRILEISSMDNELTQVLLSIAFCLYLILFAGASFGTLIVVAVRFYKNLFSDEGYLTNTLPVTKGTHLLAKTISGSIWCIIDSFVMYLCLYILLALPEITVPIGAHWDEFLDLLGFSGQGSFNLFILYVTALTIIGCISNVISIQASVVLGQLFNGHKVIGAVVSYFALAALSSIAATILMGIYGLLTNNVVIGVEGAELSFASYMTSLLNLTFGLEAAFAVILYVVSHFIMKKKINLT